MVFMISNVRKSYKSKQYGNCNDNIKPLCFNDKCKLEQLERLHSEDTPRRPMITHTIEQFILNPKSILLTCSYQIPSQNKVWKPKN